MSHPDNTLPPDLTRKRLRQSSLEASHSEEKPEIETANSNSDGRSIANKIASYFISEAKVL